MGRKRRPIFSKKKRNKGKIFLGVLTLIAISYVTYYSDKGLNLPKEDSAKQTQPTKQVDADKHTYFSPMNYKNIKTKIGNKEQIINILKVDLNRKDIEVKPIFSQNVIFGHETTSSMISREGGYAGVNGGFFGDYGQPSGLMVINGEVLTSSDEYPVFGMDNENKAFLDEIKMEAELAVGNKRIKINGINNIPSNGEAMLLTSKFGPTTRISERALNITIQNNIIKKINWSREPVNIPKDGQVLVVTGKAAEKIQSLKLEQKAKCEIKLQSHNKIKHAIECGAWLVQDGKKVVRRWDKWIGSTRSREPRTAVGLTKDNKLIILTVDGRQPGKSIGFTGSELADYMMGLGVQQAAFLDGGGSTTMWVNGKVVNTPSFRGEERKVGNAIGIFIKK